MQRTSWVAFSVGLLLASLTSMGLAQAPRSATRAVLGVSMSRTPDSVHVVAVTGQSAAEFAGVQVGDQILAIAGQPTHDFVDVMRIVQQCQPGDQVQVVVRRGAADVNLVAKLGAEPVTVVRRNAYSPNLVYRAGTYDSRGRFISEGIPGSYGRSDEGNFNGDGPFFFRRSYYGPVQEGIRGSYDASDEGTFSP